MPALIRQGGIRRARRLSQGEREHRNGIPDPYPGSLMSEPLALTRKAQGVRERAGGVWQTHG